MRKARAIIGALTLLSIIGTTGCKQSETANAFITIDVKASYPEKELTVQDFMDVEYIPLETNDEFITQCQVMDIGEKHVLVKNYINDGNIFVFDRKTGKAITKINHKGQGAEEYDYINGIVLDEDRDEMFVNSTALSKIFVYDLSGKFKRILHHSEGAEYLYMSDYDKDNLICYDMSLFYKDGEKKDKESYHVIISKQDGSITRRISIPFSIIKVPFVQKGDVGAATSVLPIIPYGKNWLLVETSSDTVYHYATEENKLSPFLAKKPTTDPDVFLTMGVVTDRYYFMKTIERTFNTETGRGFPTAGLMYDKQKNAVFTPVILNADYANQKVDLISNPGNSKIAAYQNLTADKLVEAYENDELKGKLKDIAADLDEESNPVLMLIKYKRLKFPTPY